MRSGRTLIFALIFLFVSMLIVKVFFTLVRSFGGF